MKGLLDIGGFGSEALTDQQKQFLFTQGLLGAAQGFVAAGQPSRMPISTGQAFSQGLLGAAGGIQQGQQVLAATEAAKLQRAKLGLDMTKAQFDMMKDVEQINARRALSGQPPIAAPTMSLGQSMLSGQPSTPLPGIAQVQPSAPSSDTSSMVPGVRMEVLRGEAPPSPQEAMKLSNVYLAAGDAAMASQMREYAYGGVGGYRFGSDWNSQAPIAGGKEDPGTKLVQSAAEKGLVRQADGSFGFAPGIVRSEAGRAGAVSGAQAAANAAVDLRMGPQIAAAKATAEETARKPFRADKDARDAEMKIFDDFSGQQVVKDYKQSVGFHNSMVDTYAANNTKAGDLLLIVSTAKLLDPSSVAREGEVEIVRNTGPFGSKLAGLYDYIASGTGQLTDTQKRELLAMARTKVGSLQETYDAEVGTARARATRYGIDARNVTGDLPQLRTIEDSITRSITSGKLDPAKAPGATYDTTRGGWVIPGIAGVFKEKK